MADEQTAVIQNGTAESNAINLKPFDGSGLVLITAWTAAALAFKACNTIDGTFYPVRSSAGALAEITNIAANVPAWFKLPAELEGAQFVKLWSETAGVDTNQGATRFMLVVAKG